ncbi:MAG: DNA-binding MarR family transcriptional regulator [Burkholderiaceae bacterium]|jgi:DNA-binding MarR family transcriptional regulator
MPMQVARSWLSEKSRSARSSVHWSTSTDHPLRLSAARNLHVLCNAHVTSEMRVYSCLVKQLHLINVSTPFSPVPYVVEESIGYLLGRTRAQLAKSLDDALTSHGITHAQGGILLMLMSGHFDTASQLARELYIDAAAMTRMVDRLVKRSLVIRLPSGADRRTLMLQLTAEGSALAEQLPAIYLAARARNFAGLSDEEMGFLRSLLRRVLLNGEAA